jgi:hypothetical protein
MWLAIPFFATFLGIFASLSYQFSLYVIPISTTFDTRAEWLAWALLFGSTRVYLRYRKSRIGVFESNAARPVATSLSLGALTVSIVIARVLQLKTDVSWILVRNPPMRTVFGRMTILISD